MKNTFRSRMGEMHTWAGVVLAALLFAIFWTGTLSVFDKEIDRWMMPATRLAWNPDAPPLALDRDIRPMLEHRAPKAPAWTIILPTERVPFLTLSYGTEEARKSSRDLFNPDTLQQLPAAQTLGASGFIYPFHHNLTVRYKDIGAWIVGIASMGMLCLLVSGVVIHRKIFVEFFTLRLARGFGRSNLDVHNVTGVMLLPFYIVITLSGLIVAFSIYYPSGHEALYARPSTAPVEQAMADRVAARTDADAERGRGRQGIASTAAGRPTRGETSERAFLREALGRERLLAARQPSGLASLDRIVADAETHWGDRSVYLIRVNNPKDVRGNVVLRRSSSDTVTKDIDNFRFSSATGEAMGRFKASDTVNAWNFIAGMHYIQFSHWTLRWLYFAGGLGGCVMIATGLFFWTQARRRKQQREGHFGVSMMDALSVAGVCGIVAATFAFFIIDQWLPRKEFIAGFDRDRLEIWAFYAVWLASSVHSVVRIVVNRRLGHLLAWRDQCAAIAGLAVAAVLSNWMMTGDHLPKTVFQGYWPVAGMDICLLVAAALAARATRMLRRKVQAAPHEAKVPADVAPTGQGLQEEPARG